MASAGTGQKSTSAGGSDRPVSARHDASVQITESGRSGSVISQDAHHRFTGWWNSPAGTRQLSGSSVGFAV
jgi:hypothetical protein